VLRESLLLDIGEGDQGSALAGPLLSDVAGNGTRFVNDEAVIVLISSVRIRKTRDLIRSTYKIGDLAEGLLLHEGGSLVLVLGEVDRDELEIDLLLKQSQNGALGAGRDGRTNKLDNHGWDERSGI
jgi:hypothetical protein